MNKNSAIVAILSEKDVFNLNTEAIHALQPYADGDLGHATQWARAIRMMYGYWYALEYELPEGVGERGGESKTYDNRSLSHESQIKIIPNPAGNKATLILPSSDVSLTLQIFDQLGNMIVKHDSSPGQQYMVIDLTWIAQGLYFWRLSNQQQVLATNKMLIQK